MAAAPAAPYRGRACSARRKAYTDDLHDLTEWHEFIANFTMVPMDAPATFVDDFTANTSGGPPLTGWRCCRVKYLEFPSAFLTARSTG